MSSFRMIIRPQAGNPSSAFDDFDDFSANTIANYTFDSGSGSVAGGILSTAGGHCYSSLHRFVDAEVIVGGLIPNPTNNYAIAPMVRVLDATNYLWAGNEGTSVVLYKRDNGTNTLLLAAPGIGTPIADQKYWCRIKAQGNVITAEWWISNPADGGTPQASLTYTLTGADAIKFGTGVLGYAGPAGWNGAGVTRVDDFRAHPLEVDIAPFTRVAPGEGLDPANSDYLEPAFADSPLRDGGPLINLDAKNREIQIPVNISATSKDVLTNKYEAIMRALHEPGAQLEWRDEGATRSTFFDIQTGRLNIDYNFRRSQKFWGSGVVHIWTTPFGHTNNNRIIGTLSGSGAVQGIPLEPQSNDASNLVQSGDFELGVLGLGSWALSGNGLNAGASIMQPQTIPTTSPAFVGDFVMRWWTDGTLISRGVKTPVVPFTSNSASSISAVIRIRTPRQASYPMNFGIIEEAGGAIFSMASPVVGTAWTTASVTLNIPAASLSGSYGVFLRSQGVDAPSITFEIDQLVVTKNGLPSLSIPSALDGAHAAKAVWQVTTGSYLMPRGVQEGRWVGVAALPASYIPVWSAPSIQAPNPALIGASGAQGSQLQTPNNYQTVDSQIAQVVIAADVYAGRNRVYAVGRSMSEPPAAMWLRDWEGQRVGPTVVASGIRDMHLYDMGVVNVPTAGRPSQITLTLVGYNSPLPSSLFSSRSFDRITQGGPQINELIILPEANHALIQDNVDTPSQIVYDGLYDTSIPLIGHVSDSGHTWATGLSHAASFLATAPRLLLDKGGYFSMVYPQSLADFAARIPSIAMQSFRVRSDFYVKTPTSGASYSASCWFGVRKEMSATSWVGVRVTPTAAAQGAYLAVEQGLPAGATVLASVGLPTQFNSSTSSQGSGRFRLYGEFTPTSCLAYVIDDHYPGGSNPIIASVLVTSVGALVEQSPGDPGIYMAHASSNGAGIMSPDWEVYDFRVESIPTQRIAARDVYVMDGVSGEAYRRPVAGDVQQRLTHKLRGQIPYVPVPSTSRLVGFAIGLPEGTANDLTDLQVQVREQFRFAR